jgi:hypothetical protein
MPLWCSGLYIRISDQNEIINMRCRLRLLFCFFFLSHFVYVFVILPRFNPTGRPVRDGSSIWDFYFFGWFFLVHAATPTWEQGARPSSLLATSVPLQLYHQRRYNFIPLILVQRLFYSDGYYFFSILYRKLTPVKILLAGAEKQYAP